MSPTALIADAVETVTPVLCNNNCGGRCVLRAHVRNGVVVRISTDESPDALLRPQLRACLKGRSLRDRTYDPRRLLYPLKRAGERGEGKFERISWDEAVETIAANLRRVLAQYGPEAVWKVMGASRTTSSGEPPLSRTAV